MTIIVAGSRAGIDAAVVDAVLAYQHADEPITRVLHAGHDGVDQLAARWAIKNNIQVCLFPCHCAADGKPNMELWFHGNPELLLAFPGGPGTARMVERAEMCGVPVRKVRIAA